MTRGRLGALAGAVLCGRKDGVGVGHRLWELSVSMCPRLSLYDPTITNVTQDILETVGEACNLVSPFQTERAQAGSEGRPCGSGKYLRTE